MALSGLFLRPWFKRVWVLQEVCRAESAMITCGEERVHWGDVVLASLWQRTQYKLQYSIYSLKKHSWSNVDLSSIWILLAERGRIKRENLVKLLLRARDFEATDPRDKIFAILNLAEETCRPLHLPSELRPNYTKNTNQVYCDFTKHWIGYSGSLEILSAVHSTTVESPKHHLLNTDFPSWVPKWTQGLPTRRILGVSGLYNAAGGMKALLGTSKEQRSLRIQGIRIDKVAITSEVFKQEPGVTELDRETPKGLLRTWTDIVKKMGTYPSGSKLFRAFILTLSCLGFVNGSKTMGERFNLSYPESTIIKSELHLQLEQDFAAY
jgi:hypothetical protein